VSSLDSEVLDRFVPPDPISSLRRIEALYGALAEASSGIVGGDSEYELYYTPGKLSEFTTDDPSQKKRYLLSVCVDLTSKEPTAEDVHIEVDFLREKQLKRIGYARYDKGRPYDHSVTRRGRKDSVSTDRASGYCIECLERWTSREAVEKFAENDPDGWVIKALEGLGNSEEVQERIQSQVESKYSEDGHVVSTVKLRLDPDSVEETLDGDGGWFYPGEVEVLNGGMKARKDWKLATKNVDDPSRGNSTCMITDEDGEVYGTTEDPLDMYTIQHSEKFWELNKDNSWRSHAISLDAALLLQSGSSLVEACQTTRNGLQVFTLPYFHTTTERRAEALYAALDDADGRDWEDTNQHPMQRLEAQVAENGTEEDREALQFYVISRRNDSGDINVIHEVPDVSLYEPRAVARAHETVLQSTSAFGPNGAFELETDWSPINEQTNEAEVTNEIVSGRYTWSTLPSSGEDGAGADDPQEWLTYAILTGQSVPVDRLLSGYVERLRDQRRDDEEGRHPHKHVKTQFAQLEALATAGRLTAPPDRAELTTPPARMTDTITTDSIDQRGEELSRTDVRRHRLEQFLTDRESLADDDRRSAFLTGVLVGMLAHHQRSEREMNRTLIDQHPPDQITLGRLVRVWPDLVKKASVYAADVGWAGETLFPEVLDEQVETLDHPDSWDLSLQDVRFFYALGLSYGQRADARAYETHERLTTDAGTDTDADESAE
jgi:CRISPR-associated protein Cas8b/Csh1 subtype I-B